MKTKAVLKIQPNDVVQDPSGVLDRQVTGAEIAANPEKYLKSHPHLFKNKNALLLELSSKVNVVKKLGTKTRISTNQSSQGYAIPVLGGKGGSSTKVSSKASEEKSLQIFKKRVELAKARSIQKAKDEEAKAAQLAEQERILKEQQDRLAAEKAAEEARKKAEMKAELEAEIRAEMKAELEAKTKEEAAKKEEEKPKRGRRTKKDDSAK